MPPVNGRNLQPHCLPHAAMWRVELPSGRSSADATCLAPEASGMQPCGRREPSLIEHLLCARRGMDALYAFDLYKHQGRFAPSIYR